MPFIRFTTIKIFSPVTNQSQNFHFERCMADKKFIINIDNTTFGKRTINRLNSKEVRRKSLLETRGRI